MVMIWRSFTSCSTVYTLAFFCYVLSSTGTGDPTLVLRSCRCWCLKHSWKITGSRDLPATLSAQVAVLCTKENNRFLSPFQCCALPYAYEYRVAGVSSSSHSHSATRPVHSSYSCMCKARIEDQMCHITNSSSSTGHRLMFMWWQEPSPTGRDKLICWESLETIWVLKTLITYTIHQARKPPTHELLAFWDNAYPLFLKASEMSYSLT